jgi:hypothetical protein
MDVDLEQFALPPEPTGLEFTGTAGRSATNNNPLNLEFRPGSYQEKYGATMEPVSKSGKQRFAKFPTMDAGYRAGLEQIRRDAGKGLSLSQFVNKFAPPHENPTAEITQQYAKALGVSPDTPLSNIPPEKMIIPMLARESSTRIKGEKGILGKIGDWIGPSSAEAAESGPDLSSFAPSPSAGGEKTGGSDLSAFAPPTAQAGKTRTYGEEAKVGLIGSATTAARMVDPVSAMTGAGVWPEADNPVWNAPETRAKRADVAKSVMTQALFPQGVPKQGESFADWFVGDLIQMWPTLVGLSALGPVGAATIEAIGATGALAASVGAAVPFGMLGLSEEKPVTGTAKGAALGATLGVMHNFTSYIPNAVTKWLTRIGGGAAIGAGSAYVEGASPEEIKKNAVLFAFFEALGMPKDERPAAAEKVPEATKTELMKLAEKAEGVIADYDAMSYPSTVVPGTVDTTVGKGKKARTEERAASVDIFPAEEKLTPARMELITKAAGRERQLEIDKAPMQWSREKGRWLDQPVESGPGEMADYQRLQAKAEEGTVAYSGEEKAPAWYSQMGRTITDKLPGRGTGEGLANTIESWASKGMFKKEELKWSGLVPWLKEQKGPVTKQQVLDKLKEGEVRVEVVEKADSDITGAEPDLFGDYTVPIGGTKFQSYLTDLPESFTNRREMLLTVPRNLETFEQFKQRMVDSGEVSAETFKKNDAIWRRRFDAAKPKVEGEYQVPPAHAYGDTAADVNRFAHVFLADYVDPKTGKKNLVVTETQSDWTREGRSKGYRLSNEKIAEYKKEQESLIEQYNKAWEDAGFPDKIKNWENLSPKSQDIIRGLNNRLEEIRDTLAKDRLGAVPPLPFVKNWHEVALKQAIRYAAENGYDGVIVVNGDMVKQRYDLSRYFKKVKVFKQENGNYIIDGMPEGEHYRTLADDVSPDKLNNYIGKELADKVLTGEGRSVDWTDAYGDKVGVGKEFTGLDLQVGGEWANNLYDKTIPSYLRKYVKQWGAHVSEIPLSGLEGKVHSFDITPSMKQSVMTEGQPMFRDARGKPVPLVVNEETLGKAFGPESGAVVSRMGDGDYLAQLPNGSAIRIYPNSDITVDPKAWALAYQSEYSGNPVYGQWSSVNYGGIIKLAKEGPPGTLKHEVGHGVWRLALTPDEQASLLDKYVTEEKVMRAYEERNPKELGPVFTKIRDFFRSILDAIFPNRTDAIFRRMESGEVWKRTPAERAGVEEAPMKYSGLTDAWEELKRKRPVGRPSAGQLTGYKKLLDETKRLFAPETRGPEAMQTAQDWVKCITEARANVLRAMKVMNDYRVEFKKMDYDDRWKLSAAMERGEQVPPEWRPYAQARKEAFDLVHKEISRIRDGLVGYRNNYAPHLYADPDKAALFFDTLGKRPLEGKKGFLKERYLPDMDAARAKGLEPLFDNPVQQDLAGLMEQWRYVAGNDFINVLEKRDRFIPTVDGKPKKLVPEGWVKTDPRVFRNGYAPREAIDVIHNHLISETGNLWYNTWKNATAMWNAWHVTISAFHAVTTLGHELSMGFAKGIPDLVGAMLAGDYARAADAIKRVGPMAVVNTFRMAKKGEESFHYPGKHGPKIDNLVKVVTEGGLLPENTMLMSGQAAESFKELFTQLKGGEIGRSFRSLTHLMGKPIMGYLVPTVKYGSTLVRTEREMNRLRERYNKKYGTNWSPETEANFTKDIANVAYNERQFSENIFGEIHPDNLHWNRAMSGWLKGLIAYPGWNIGTLRFMAGMARGAVQTLTGKELDYQARSSLQFGAGLLITVGLANSIMHMALNNGKPPEDWKDVLIGARTGRYLNNGAPERVTIASYMKDIMAMATHPGKAVLAKLQAPFTIMKELYDNADYFGTEIIPGKGGVGEKAASLGKYLGGKALPFGASGIMTGKSPITKYGGFVGLRTVPRALTNTVAQNKIDDILQAQSPRTRTQEQSEASRTVADLKELGWAGQRSEMEKGVREAKQAGKLTEIQANHIRQDTLKDKRVVQFRKLRNIEDALEVYELGTPDERRLWRLDLANKWSRVSLEKKRRFRKEYQDAVNMEVAENMPERVPPRETGNEIKKFSILNQ